MGNLTGSVDYLWEYAARRSGFHGGGDRLGLWPHEPLQLAGRQGPLAFALFG